MTDRTVGFFNPVHPWNIQVLGEAGARYLSRLGAAARAALPRALAGRGMTTLIVARGVAADLAAWTAAGIECSARPARAHDIVHTLRQELPRSIPERTVHGVLMDVHGVGVLIEGAAASGKSTLALDLLARGHALVADDAVELRRLAAGVIVGRSPGVLRGFLEARGLGVVDIRRMHGARAIRTQARLDLVVQLVPRGRAARGDRLSGARSRRRVLGEPIPAVAFPQTRHNLAALVEAACLDRRLRLDGIEADAALTRRQARALKKP